MSESTVRANNTLATANATEVLASHVGQVFFDQDLITQVEATSPYSENTQTLTLNSEDSILASEAESVDPFVEYILLGDKIEDGILAWISIGIDPTASSEITAAAVITEDGGYANENASAGGPGGAPPGDAPGASSGSASSSASETSSETATAAGSASTTTQSSGASRMKRVVF